MKDNLSTKPKESDESRFSFPISLEKSEESTSNFPLFFTWTCSALLSFFIAVLSINNVIMQIFLWTNIACLVLVNYLSSKKKSNAAYLAALAPIPTAFFIAIMYSNFIDWYFK
jgi:hypothetical protein